VQYHSQNAQSRITVRRNPATALETRVAAPSYSINAAPAPAPADLVDALRATATAHLSDNLHRLAGTCGLRRIHRAATLAGTAFTVKTRPGDNLLIYKALTMLCPGHVLVVDGGGDTTNALVGELIMSYARQRGCAGFVLDAAVRDSAAFHDADFPCYARGVSHRGPYKSGPGEINTTIAVDGLVVRPGDLVVGDADGVVAFPLADSQRLLDAARASAAAEASVKAEIAGGLPQQSWITRALLPHGL
jgi:regulator of RNase E activity RraA